MLQGIGNSPLCRSDWRCGQRGESKMKRLFTLKYKSGRLFTEDGQPVYHDSKQAIKKIRDDLNKDMPDHAEVKVSIGPDHWRYQG